MATQEASQAKKRISELEKKWSRELLEVGWSVIPSIILEKQKALGLDSLDINIILQLITFWWFEGRPAHPSKKTLAEAIDVSESTIRKRIARLEKDGFITRSPRFTKEHGQVSNEYLFDGLIEAAKPFALEKAKETQEKRNSEKERRKRIKPKLQAVPS